MSALFALLRIAFVLGVLAGVVTAFNIGVPYVALQVGLGTGYDAGAFRRGFANYQKSFDVSGQSATRRVGIAFGRSGEAVRIDWDGTLETGEATLIVSELLGGGTDPIWRTRLYGRTFGSATVPIHKTGLFQIRFSRTRWTGDMRIRWRVVPGSS